MVVNGVFLGDGVAISGYAGNGWMIKGAVMLATQEGKERNL